MKSPRMVKRYLVWVVVLVVVTLGATQLIAAKQNEGTPQATSPAQTPTQPAGNFVGSETCKGCHEDQSKSIDRTAHHQLAAGESKGTGIHGCESCHGPGAAHVEAGGDKTKIYNFDDSGKAISDRCLTCHANAGKHANDTRSQHYKNGVGCTSCHSPHKAKEANYLLINKQPDLCYSCHANNKMEFNKPFRHRVNEGLIGCSDCHDVHGSTQARQLRTSRQRDAVCFQCHSDKKGPFTFEHLPVKTEGCSSCHTPHGSTNPRLLTRSTVNQVCMECHGVASLPALHNQSTKYQACTMCHTYVHGSHTSNVFFKP
jgi:DmsE family decaheme c-type cytochrome